MGRLRPAWTERKCLAFGARSTWGAAVPCELGTWDSLRERRGLGLLMVTKPLVGGVGAVCWESSACLSRGGLCWSLTLDIPPCPGARDYGRKHTGGRVRARSARHRQGRSHRRWLWYKPRLLEIKNKSKRRNQDGWGRKHAHTHLICCSTWGTSLQAL